MPISTSMGKKVLDGIFRNIYFEWPSAIHVRLWTVAPDGNGTGGTEATGASVRPILYSAAAADGVAGERARVVSSQSVVFEAIDQASSAIVHASFHDDATGEMVWDTPWSPPADAASGGWAAGASPSISAADIVNAFTA